MMMLDVKYLRSSNLEPHLYLGEYVSSEFLHLLIFIEPRVLTAPQTCAGAVIRCKGARKAKVGFQGSK